MTSPTSNLAPSRLVLPILSSLYATQFLARLESPSISGVAVKVLPCVTLLYYLLQTQANKHSSGGSFIGSLLDITGLDYSNDENKNFSPKTSKYLLKRGEKSGGRDLADGGNGPGGVHKRLLAGVSRGLIMSMVGDALLVSFWEPFYFTHAIVISCLCISCHSIVYAYFV